jgi:hypothetical protein
MTSRPDRQGWAFALALFIVLAILAATIFVANTLRVDPDSTAPNPEQVDAGPADSYSLDGFNEGVTHAILTAIQAAELAAPSVEQPEADVGSPEPVAYDGAGGWAACVRAHESGGDYAVVSSNGLYYGAYQFLRSTWDNAAAVAGRSDLVGIPPNQVAPADQDAIALSLYANGAGASHWAGTGC